MAKSFRGGSNSLVDTFQTLSLNSSNANGTLGTLLINEQSKYLVLKYFDTERTVTMLTSGSTTATLTSGPVNGATSATLQSAWPTSNISCQQLTTFSDGEMRNAYYVQGSSTITWQSALATGTTASLGTTATLSGVQFYPLPANVSKVKNGTITIGQLVYTPAPVMSIQEWTKLNALPYASNIPAYFYIYNNQIGFWPIPSTSGEVITINCQVSVPDMTYTDYTAGTIATSGVVVGSNIVTGSSTSWTSQFPTNQDLTFANLFLTITPPNGDGYMYQIQSFQSDTALTLVKPIVNTPKSAAANYVIGQYPYLSPDFHDAILYGALRIYYNSIVKDAERYQMYNTLFKEKTDLIEFYLSNKSVNVDLGTQPLMQNPNLFWNGTS